MFRVIFSHCYFLCNCLRSGFNDIVMGIENDDDEQWIWKGAIILSGELVIM